MQTPEDFISKWVFAIEMFICSKIVKNYLNARYTSKLFLSQFFYPNA